MIFNLFVSTAAWSYIARTLNLLKGIKECWPTLLRSMVEVDKYCIVSLAGSTVPRCCSAPLVKGDKLSLSILRPLICFVSTDNRINFNAHLGCTFLELKLPYHLVCPSVGWTVGRDPLIRRSVCHNFLIGTASK